MTPNSSPAVVPAITDRAALHAEHARQRARYRELTAQGAPLRQRAGALAGVVISWIFLIFPIRVLTHYMFHGGPLMAAGLAYQLLFASTALLVIGFSTVGMVLGGDSDVQQSLVDAITRAIPGLLDRGDGQGGVIPLEALGNSAPFTLAGAVAAAVLVFTAWRWVAGIRLAIRRIFELPPAPSVPIAAVPQDLMWLVVIGLLLAGSAVATVMASGALETLLNWAQSNGWLHDDPKVDGSLNGVLTFAAAVILDLLMCLSLIRGVARLKLRRKALVVALVTGVVGLQALRYGGSVLIARSTDNPYLFSFAVLVGVLLWFNFYGQVLLVAAATGAIVQADLRDARAQPEREPRAVTVVAADALPQASRGASAPGAASPE